MIVSDLDDTLLTRDKCVSEYSVKVLRKYQKSGIKIVLATARSEKAALPYVDVLKPDIVIYNNGALVKCKNDIIFEEQISCEVCSELLKNCAVYKLKNTKVVTRVDDFSNAFDIGQGNSEYRFDDYHDFKQNAYKVTIKAKEDIIEEFKELHKNCSVIKYKGRNSYVFTHICATKEIALRRVAEWSGVDMSNIIAFGDDLGDIGMIKACGLGIAVANAKSNVKAVANEICGSNEEDGVAKWLENNISLKEVNN